LQVLAKYLKIAVANIKSRIDSAFYPPWDGEMSTSQRAVMLCGWEGARRKVMAAYRWVKSSAG